MPTWFRSPVGWPGGIGDTPGSSLRMTKTGMAQCPDGSRGTLIPAYLRARDDGGGGGPEARARGGKGVKHLIFLALFVLAACDNSADIRAQRQAEVDVMRGSLSHLNALEDRVYALVDLDRDTGRLVLVGSVQDLEAVKREAQETALDSCTGNARDELVLTVDHILRGQTDAAAAGEAWEHAEAYIRAAESCENWLSAQAPR
jgi:hypothetical protein